jgi:hypothetical protein
MIPRLYSSLRNRNNKLTAVLSFTFLETEVKDLMAILRMLILWVLRLMV